MSLFKMKEYRDGSLVFNTKGTSFVTKFFYSAHNKRYVMIENIHNLIIDPKYMSVGEYKYTNFKMESKLQIKIMKYFQIDFDMEVNPCNV